MTSNQSRKLQVALIQLAVGSVKVDNLTRAATKVKEAASKGAKLIALPECFNSPYGADYFPIYAENIPGETTNLLSNLAKDNGIYLIGGSFPEREGDRVYNTCTVWNPLGKLIAKHRKVHLVDIDVPGEITFREAISLSSGNSFTTFQLGEFKIGVGVCFDIRFAELAQVYSKMGCHLLVYPGAFNLTTGPAHLEVLQRARALDNQVYVAAVSTARDTSASYVAWGYSAIVDPWGKVVVTTDEKEDIVYGEIDLDQMEKMRKMLPTFRQKREDMYQITYKEVHDK